MEREFPPIPALANDPDLDAEVAHAIAPYRALLPPEMLEVLRATIAEAYLEHPAGRRILHNLREETRLSNETGDMAIVPADDAELESLQPLAAGIHGRRG